MRGRKMEGEKKRKRAEHDQVIGGERRNDREGVAATPTDEEVDEFFAILRRMQVAVKYFKKGAAGNAAAGHKFTAGRWATALEAQVLAGVRDLKASEESVCGLQKNRALDLNSVPEAESNSL